MPPPPIAPPPPVSQGPTAAQIAAAKRAAARAKARKRALRAKRLAAQRKRAAAKRRAAAARKREAERREMETAGTSVSRNQSGGGAATSDSARKAIPFVAAAAVAALFILGLGLVPAYVVPWYRMSVVLEDHRQQFAFVGGMALLGSGIFFALTFLSS